MIISRTYTRTRHEGFHGVGREVSQTKMTLSFCFSDLKCGVGTLSLITHNPNLHITCSNKALEFYLCVRKSHQLKEKIAVPIFWVKPPGVWYELNTDD